MAPSGMSRWELASPLGRCQGGMNRSRKVLLLLPGAAFHVALSVLQAGVLGQ